jgi:hypothetical protein
MLGQSPWDTEPTKAGTCANMTKAFMWI